MTSPRSAPIGKTWTRVLRLVHDKQFITTEGITAELYPLAGAPPPRSGAWPPTTDAAGRMDASDAARLSVRLMLARMAKHGYLARDLPLTTGELWRVGEVGAHLIEELARPRRRAYKTTRHRRKMARARRDAARALERRINENARGTHGPATNGVRCAACDETHRRSR